MNAKTTSNISQQPPTLALSRIPPSSDFGAAGKGE
jgi:hypothetical protein